MARALGVATTAILAAIQGRVRYGLDISEETGLLPGTVYTTLRRLEKRGLVEGRWEAGELAEAEGRPRRRYYELTPAGERELERSLERLGTLVGDMGIEIPATGRDV